jgi:hypothetical protein
MIVPAFSALLPDPSFQIIRYLTPVLGAMNPYLIN